MAVFTFDFETNPITDTDLWPEPFLLVYQVDDEEIAYTTDKDRMSTILEFYQRKGCIFVGHNIKFDLGVAIKHLGFPQQFDNLIYDTSIAAFLANPFSKSYALKYLAEEILGQPPEEQSAMRDWLITNKVAKKNQKEVGHLINKVPLELVIPYAIGDVQRTRDLYKHFGMSEPMLHYSKLLKVLMTMEHRGVQLNLPRLEATVTQCNKDLLKLESHLRTQLGVENLNSPYQLAATLKEQGLVPGLKVTASGKESVDKVVIQSITDETLRDDLQYSKNLRKILTTYLEPWKEFGYVLHFNWRTTASADGGAKTGRLQSSPNLQNIPNVKDEKLPHPKAFIIPRPGNVFIGRDYSQQELRMAAHYEGGKIAALFKAQPDVDLHLVTVDELLKLKVEITRNQAKVVNFGLIYGMGTKKLAEGLGVDISKAKEILTAHKKAFPGLHALMTKVQKRVTSGGVITTINGRKYPLETAVIKGEDVEFPYKALNHLIQGSSADQTQLAMIAYNQVKGPSAHIVLAVHDEIIIECHNVDADAESDKLRIAMETKPKPNWEIPILTSEKRGYNLQEIK